MIVNIGIEPPKPPEAPAYPAGLSRSRTLFIAISIWFTSMIAWEFHKDPPTSPGPYVLVVQAFFLGMCVAMMLTLNWIIKTHKLTVELFEAMKMPKGARAMLEHDIHKAFQAVLAQMERDGELPEDFEINVAQIH